MSVENNLLQQRRGGSFHALFASLHPPDLSTSSSRTTSRSKGRKELTHQVKKVGFCPNPPSFLPPLLFPACFLLPLAALRALLNVSAVGSHCARRLRWWCASKKDERTNESKQERKSGQNDRPTEQAYCQEQQRLSWSLILLLLVL